jgi:hypothetical protein
MKEINNQTPGLKDCTESSNNLLFKMIRARQHIYFDHFARIT